jgi:hypothetical protein
MRSMSSPHGNRPFGESLSASFRHCLLFARLRLVLAAMLLAGAGAVPGCYSRPGPPEVSEEQFSASQLTVEPVNGLYVVSAQVGSPGYALVLDSTWDAYRGKHVYVTIRRPDPRFTYAQVVTELRLLTTVETRESITVFARTAERDEEDIEDEYRLAAQAVVATPQSSDGLIVK